MFVSANKRGEVNKTIALLSKNRPLMHSLHGKPDDWGISKHTIEFFRDNVKSSWFTLEIGSGISTLVLTALAHKHTAINPSIGDKNRVDKKIQELTIEGNLHFIRERSEHILPSLEGKYDLILIDGCHTFPWPTTDWFYSVPLLKNNGLIVLDDIDWWPVRIVHEYMIKSPGWRLRHQDERYSVFQLKSPELACPSKWELQPPLEINYD